MKVVVSLMVAAVAAQSPAPAPGPAASPSPAPGMTPVTGNYVGNPINYDNWDVSCTLEAGGNTLLNYGTLKKGCCDAAKSRALYGVVNQMPTMAAMAKAAATTCFASSFYPVPSAACDSDNIPVAMAFAMAGSVGTAESCTCMQAQHTGLKANPTQLTAAILPGYETNGAFDCGVPNTPTAMLTTAGYNATLNKLSQSTPAPSTTPAPVVTTPAPSGGNSSAVKTSAAAAALVAAAVLA